jgi:tetratricopeptide (TPR) repeat protein
LAEESGNLNARGIAYQGMGYYELHLGHFEQSMAYAQRSEEVFRQAGDLHGLGNALSMVAFNRIHQGYLAESLDNVQELITTGQDGADPQLICWGSITRGIARARLGLLDQAAIDFEEGLRLTDMLPDYYWKILGQAFYGRCLLWQGQLTQAFAALDEGERVYKKRGIGGPVLYQLRIIQAEAHLMAAEHDDRHKASHLKQAKRASKVAHKLSKAYRLFRAETHRVRGTIFWMQGKNKNAKDSWKRSLDIADKQKHLYECGLTYLEMGLRLQDRSYLEPVEAILSEIGAGFHLTQLQRVRQSF